MFHETFPVSPCWLPKKQNFAKYCQSFLVLMEPLNTRASAILMMASIAITNSAIFHIGRRTCAPEIMADILRLSDLITRLKHAQKKTDEFSHSFLPHLPLLTFPFHTSSHYRAHQSHFTAFEILFSTLVSDSICYCPLDRLTIRHFSKFQLACDNAASTAVFLM